MSRGKAGRRKKRSEIKELLLLLILKLESPIGRYRLKDMLDLSDHEGLVRLMLSDLHRDGYVSAGKAGCKLTVKGEDLLNQRLMSYGIANVQYFDAGPLKAGPASVGVFVKEKADRIESVMERRDIAVRFGAHGATILIFKGGVLSIPTVYPDLSTKHPEITKRILKSFPLDEGDVLVIGFSDDKWRALEGALAVAITLNQ